MQFADFWSIFFFSGNHPVVVWNQSYSNSAQWILKLSSIFFALKQLKLHRNYPFIDGGRTGSQDLLGLVPFGVLDDNIFSIFFSG